MSRLIPPQALVSPPTHVARSALRGLQAIVSGRRSHLAAVVTGCLVLAAGPGTPLVGATQTCAEAQESGIVELCGTTVVEASETSAIRIRLPREVRFAPASTGGFFGVDGGIDVTVDGEGLFAGFALAQTAAAEEPTGLMGGWIDPAVVDFWTVRSFGRTSGNIAEGFTVPAGDYTLYVVTEGASVVVTLRPDGLAGSVQLTATEPVQHVLQVLSEEFKDPAGLTFAAGAEGPLHSPGLAFRAIYVLSEPHVSTVLGSCIYAGRPAHGYLPRCPSGPLIEGPLFSGQYPSVSPTLGPAGYGFSSLTAGLSAGSYGQAVWYTAAAQVSHVGTVGLWLTLQ